MNLAIKLALASELPFDVKGRVRYAVSVDGDNARYTRTNLVTKKSENVIVALPAPVRAFIKRFDSKNDIFPAHSAPTPIRFTTAIPFKAKQ